MIVFACLQTFLQRGQNYVMSMAIAVIVRMFRKDEIDFAQRIGQEMQSIRTGVASSAALIVTADWALEYPQPMPPRVHVSCLARPPLFTVSQSLGACSL